MNSLRKSKVGERPDGTLPLINIVLLLVLAFMMAGTIAAPLPTGFDPLRSTSDEEIAATPTVAAFLVDENGQASREADMSPVGDLGDLGETFTRLATTDTPLALRFDARVPASKALEILALARTSGLKQVMIVTLEKP